jgi:saccharopine dehydrogenase (NAD+, L-lysine-forming)
MSDGAILIAGGYGVVGRRIAEKLAPCYPGRVIVAGRSQERSEATAGAIGHGVRGRRLDVFMPASISDALVDVAVAVSCVDQPERGLLHGAIERGLAYTDITPHLTELGRGGMYEQIEAASKAAGARVVLGAGIAPGISNVMVRAVADKLGGADTIETALLLSASDATGPASFDYFLDELTMPFVVHIDGEDRPARAFSQARPVAFPAPIGTRRAYLFPFSDQVLYPRTMGARTVTTRLALEPERMARALTLLTHTPAVGLVQRKGLRRALARARGRRPPRPDARFALRVDVRNGDRTGTATLAGRVQANAAAIAAADITRALVDGDITEAGAWMPEQVIDSARFLGALARDGLEVHHGPVMTSNHG